MSASVGFLRSGGREHPSLSVGLRAWLLRRRLDSDLAKGVEPSASPELRWRAGRLTSPREREQLAACIARVLVEAEAPPLPGGPRIPLNRREIRSCRRLLAELVQELRGPDPVVARGVVRLQCLLRDGSSPLYLRSAPGELDQAVRLARTTLLLQ